MPAAETRTQILVVDDDPNIAQLIRLCLTQEGYDVHIRGRGDTAIECFRSEKIHLILLDVMLPGMDGWQVLREIRQSSKVPIIMLTAKDDTFDKVLGLELGADDYITKPFENKELTARVKAVLRRTVPEAAAGQPQDLIAAQFKNALLVLSIQASNHSLSFRELRISLDTYEVIYRGKPVEMPPKELEVLYFLASHQNRVFTREQLLEQVWGFDFFGDSRTVDVHIKRLREKLADSEQFGWQIKTVWGVGYKFDVKE